MFTPPPFIRAAVGAFIPADLFSSSETGEWWRVHPDDLRQGDTEGSTAAAVDSEVGWMRGKVNGHHATQATSSLRPILRQTGGGLYYLEPDGTDDYFDFPALGITGSTAREFFFSGHISTNLRTVLRIGPTSTGNKWEIRNDSNAVRVEIAGGGYTSSLGITSDGVYGAVLTGTTLASHVLHAGTSTENASGSTSVDTIDSDRFLFQGTSGRFMTGRFYGGVIIGRGLTTQERADLKAYLAEQAGVTL